MRIALISEHASPLAQAGGIDAGGQNIYVAHVARCLAAQGHGVDVLTRRDEPTLPGVMEWQPRLRVLHLEAGPPEFVPKESLLQHMPAFAASASRWFAHNPAYDVQHANFFMSGWVGLALRRRFGVPLATTFHALGLVRHEHQGDADQFPPERVAIERSVVHGSDCLIAECPQDAADLTRLYGARPEQIVTVPCGVDTDEFRPGDRQRARARLGLGRREFIVLQLGRLVPRKGIDNVVRALALLPASLPARLVVVGGGSPEPDEAVTPEIGRLRALAASLGVAERVHFTGRRERHQLRDWYVAADVFATTPWYEPFGITPLEAMACATPVIGSAVGGIAHTVVDGITGFLVPPRDPQALAARLLFLQANPELAAAVGQAGVRRVREGFTWERVSHLLATQYALLRHEHDGLPRPAVRPLAGGIEPLRGLGATP
ncbi:MAG TPA: glycosyltransferase family 1 protein [Burkholderiaceae bacterium]|nr:glycosyltransferase family 1 protein [Burkholderiaceae bacterium]